MGKTVRDESTASAYWAAVNTFCALSDVHVIADAPVGCYNLVGAAVIDYTDAIPYLENFTPHKPHRKRDCLLGKFRNCP